MDDYQEHFISELSLFWSINQAFSPVNLIRNIHSLTGKFESGSLTSILIQDDIDAQLEFQSAMDKNSEELISLVDVTIPFTNTKQRMLKTKVDFSLTKMLNPYQHYLFSKIRKHIITLL